MKEFLYKHSCLSLSDGSKWQLTGDIDTNLWVNELAVILNLTPELIADEAKTIAFVKEVDKHKNGKRLYSESFLTSPPNTRWMFREGKNGYSCQLKEHENYLEKYSCMMLSLLPVYQQSIHKGGLPFHAGLVETKGCGILLAASGGTGKSTSCKRLPNNWKSLCDDEALVVLDNQNSYRAHPFPTWSDYLWRRAKNTWGVQYSVPLRGIFFLEQFENNEVSPIGEGKATVYIAESAFQACQRFYSGMNKEKLTAFRTIIFNNACKIAKKIPAFRLRISLHGQFWREIEKVLF